MKLRPLIAAFALASIAAPAVAQDDDAPEAPPPRKTVRVTAVALAVPAAPAGGMDAAAALGALARGEAKLVAQSALHTFSGQRGHLEGGRVHHYPTEAQKIAGALIPTRSKAVARGAELDVKAGINADGSAVQLAGHFRFNAAAPADPTLAEILAALPDDEKPAAVPAPKFAESIVPLAFDALPDGKTEVIAIDPPPGIDAGMKFLVLIKAAVVAAK